jgi:Prokaryotic phospholipase A2
MITKFQNRNYKNQDRFNDQNKEKIDKAFRNDMAEICDKYGGDFLCETSAKVYYGAVKLFGKDLNSSTSTAGNWTE